MKNVRRISQFRRRLRSKRQNSPYIFQVVASLTNESLFIILLALPSLDFYLRMGIEKKPHQTLEATLASGHWKDPVFPVQKI
jgi:hypothetical protein